MHIPVAVVAMVMGHVVEMESKNLAITPKNHDSKKRFNIQWHITAECNQDCVHCYVKDSRTYKQEIENYLSLNRCEHVIDNLTEN